MPNINKTAALNTSTWLDRVASDIETNADMYGIPQHIAADFANKCDKLADFIEKRAGFNPQDIGKVTPGNVDGGPSGHFTQKEFSEVEGVVKKASVLAPMARLAAAYAAANEAILANEMGPVDLQAANGAIDLATQVLLKAAGAEFDEEEEGEDSEEDGGSEDSEEESE